MEHTPALWINRTAGDPTPGSGLQIYAGIQNIATVHYGKIDIDEAFANARLIAAAPELLAALEGAYKALQTALKCNQIAMDDYAYIGEWTDEVREVITKAKG